MVKNMEMIIPMKMTSILKKKKRKEKKECANLSTALAIARTCAPLIFTFFRSRRPCGPNTTWSSTPRSSSPWTCWSLGCTSPSSSLPSATPSPSTVVVAAVCLRPHGSLREPESDKLEELLKQDDHNKVKSTK